MKTNRRDFLSAGLVGSFAATLPFTSGCSQAVKSTNTDYSKLDDILNQPVLKKEYFTTPVIIESLELLRFKDSYLCRVKSTDGAEGISVGHPFYQIVLEFIFVRLLQPYFIGKDARNLDSLLEEVTNLNLNYRFQGSALGVPMAAIEFAILDMLGRIADLPMGKLIGDIHNPKLGVYLANDNRGRSAEESIERLVPFVKENKVKAIKIKIGAGHGSYNVDNPPGRTEKWIPMVRETLGDDMVLYADSNGSYTVDEAIRVGKQLEEYRYEFYEEPVMYDWYEETKQVADALNIPVAGGEQEPGIHAFRWLIGNNALQIVQPDTYYFGGMIRSMKVARMAEIYGVEFTPHMSGGGLGYIYMLHMTSAVPNACKYHEFKSSQTNVPFECRSSNLAVEDGLIKVPTGPGSGVEVDPEFVDKHSVIVAN
ncbi:mandelate racemase/muconate lactonizing enzyme family protein [Bacteroidota bacterium]